MSGEKTPLPEFKRSETEYLGRDGTTFEEPFSYGAGNALSAMALGDLDLDGDQDVVTTNGGGRVGTSILFNRCIELLRGDLDRDGVVGVSDLLQLLAGWGSCNACPADLDGDGAVNVADLLSLLAHWTT